MHNVFIYQPAILIFTSSIYTDYKCNENVSDVDRRQKEMTANKIKTKVVDCEW